MKKIIKNKFLFFFLGIMFSMQAQENTVKGVVTDSNIGSPLPGASVLVKGKAVGVTTDFDGAYTIRVTQNDTLIISFVGYKTQQIPVAGKTTINVALQEEASQLEEIVVVGYGAQKKSSVTGAVSNVKGEELTKVVTANATELLGGRVSGLLTKQTSAVPGSDGTTLSIRGFGNPLVVVDGVQVPSGLSRINPQDIESISVLKDAAAAIYGIRGGNGVILVTTKRGKEGKPTITFNTSTNFQQPVIWRNNVNALQFAELENDVALMAGDPLPYSDEDLENYRIGAPGYESYNWEKAIFQNYAPMQQHNLSVRGGSEKIKFYTSVGLVDQEGAFKSGDLNYKNLNIRSNIDAQITNNIKTSFDLSYRTEKRSEPGQPLGTVYNQITVSEPFNPPVLPGYPELAAYSGGGFANRAALASTYRNFSGFKDQFTKLFSGNFKLSYDIPGVTGLSVRGELAFTQRHRHTKDLEIPVDVYRFNFDTNLPEYSNTRGVSSLDEDISISSQLMPSFRISYKRNLEKHSIDAFVLAEAIEREGKTIGAFRRDLLSSQFPYLNYGSEIGLDNSGGANESGLASFVGRLNYGYLGKYFLETTLRYDGSSRFKEGSTRWGLFPSIGLTWNMHKEAFIQDGLSFVDRLKLRLSYSNSGNDNTDGAFEYLALFGLDGSYLFGATGATTAISTLGLPNPNVTWADVTLYNAGLEANLWKGKLGVELDVFYRLRDNLFGPALDQYPSTFGADLPELNLRSNNNRGFDITLTHNNSIGKDFKYNIGATLGYSREKYKVRPQDLDINVDATTFGEDPNDPEFISWFNRVRVEENNWTNRTIGYKTDGIFMSQEEIDNHPVDQSRLAGGTGNSNVKPGDIKYVDLNGDGVINGRDRDVIGKGDFPDTTFGLNLGVEYKNFSLNALFQGATGFNFNIGGGARTIFDANKVPYEYQYKYRWTPDPSDPTVNINPNAKLPAASDGAANNNNTPTSDFWLQDGTYVRLKNLNIAYNLPQSVLNNVGIKSLQIYVAGTNLLTWNKLGIYKGSFDSEGPRNQAGSTYPLVKTFTLGANITL